MLRLPFTSLAIRSAVLSTILAAPAFTSPLLLADVRLPSLLTSGAVLQRDQPISIWGEADPAEEVAISFVGKEIKVKADERGQWKAELPGQPAGGPFEMKVAGKNSIELTDIYVGEVWVASGQSNMDFRLIVHGKGDSPYVIQSRETIAAADDPKLRVFSVDKLVATEPLNDLSPYKTAKWTPTTPTTAGGITAVGYHFAKMLREKLDVPVGIIHSAWGGTVAESWMSVAKLQAAGFEAAVKRRADVLNRFPEENRKYEEVTLKNWEAAVSTAKAEGKPLPPRPQAPWGPDVPHLAGQLFNGMIYPLTKYRIAGVIWYQGESNAVRPTEYRTLFPALIADWRKHWGQGGFPFIFVQLANYKELQKLPVEDTDWPLLREAQLQTLTEAPNTGMAIAIDLADADNPGDIHPHNKKDVGERLALNALAKVYNQRVASYSGPIYQQVRVEGEKAYLTFAHADGGLKAKGDKLQGFAIAGENGEFVWADATIEGNNVVVTSDAVARPTAVRYGWAMNPIGNLYNGAGLPASPFRTDAVLSAP